ncbi:MAG: radical SAM protein [Bacteroidales bacterium]|nr:radical SAM protein [Bacteroidales bacterium]
MPRFHISNIVYELTGACNQNCRFCYNHWRPEGAPAPDRARARKTLRKLLSQCSVGTISFSGGEPLLLPNIHDLVLRARLRGSHVNVLTNGTLLSPDALDNFVSLGVGAIQIPLLSADPAVHDYLTGVKGSWDKALDALRRTGGKGIGVAVLVITKVNAPGVAETLSLIRECGIRTVMVNRFNIGGNGIRNMRELVPGRQTFADAFAAVESFAAANPDMRFVSGVCTPLCFLDTAPYPHIKFTTCSTELSGRPVTVNYNGDVRFCNHSPRVLGNIYSRPIGEILQDPDINALYAGMPAECSDCHLLERCGGGCRAASEQLYGTFSKQDPILDTASL